MESYVYHRFRMAFQAIIILCLADVLNLSSSNLHPPLDEAKDTIKNLILTLSVHNTWIEKRNIHTNIPTYCNKNPGGSFVIQNLTTKNEGHVNTEEHEGGEIKIIGDKEKNRIKYNGSYDDNSVKDNWILHAKNNTSIPDAFDARDEWPECPSIGQIRDQSICGACWAFAITEMITDRICIRSNGTSKPEISAEDLLTCGSLYSSPSGDGCRGGSIDEALQYWVEHGISTGGDYGTKNGCKSYSFVSCVTYNEGKNSTRPRCPDGPVHSPSCKKSCDDEVRDVYEKTLYFGERIYNIPKNEQQIQLEILSNGPVVAIFLVHEDFMHYRNGVYKHLNGNRLFYHSIKMIGWGMEDETPYWLIANSQNEEWGENGFFRILRGSNECKIEEFVYGGIPKLNNSF